MNSAADEIRKGDWPPVTHPPPPPPPPPQPRPRRGHLAYWLVVPLEPKKSVTVQNRPYGYQTVWWISNRIVGIKSLASRSLETNARTPTFLSWAIRTAAS
jgi:hypothetical protein